MIYTLQLEQCIKFSIMKSLNIIVIFLLILMVNLDARITETIESQPEILFQYKKLTSKQDNISLRVKFNRAVLYLENKEYLEAINLFKQTAKIMKVPSFLNIGIAYLKLNSTKNAYLYLKKIYDVKEAINEDMYSYMSASYYLYQISHDKKYIKEIIKIASKKGRLTEPVKRLVADTYIELRQYKKALKVLKDMEYPLDLKIGLLYIKTKQYKKAIRSLNKALEITTNDDTVNKILWFKIYTNLKSNNINQLSENIDDIRRRQRIFKTHIHMPIRLFFNREKYSAKNYFDSITNFSLERKIDFIFYFSPYIFADNNEISFEENQAFILKDNKNILKLKTMIDYNSNFIKIVKDDPIQRAFELQKIINKTFDTKPYQYYNLALAYAQIDDFHKAHKYFNKAYSLNKKNKLFAIMTLISASRVKIKMSKKVNEKLRKTILARTGDYKYYAQYIFKMLYDDKVLLKSKYLTSKLKKSIFFRALYFLDHVNEDGIEKKEPLLVEFNKDPLVYLLTLVAREDNESDYQYISRIQDNIPTQYNDIFIKGPLIITRYYIDTLKAMGMLNVADLTIDGDDSPTYYRTKALIDLYKGKPKSTIKIINQLQSKYLLEDRYTFFLLIAALLESNNKDNAFITLSLVKAILNDSDADFLTGIQLIQELKLNTAIQYFKYKYGGELVDFELVGLDEYLSQL